ncbi:hypothetical protein TNCV_2158381 [Trichonephila clavipes]|nr:hypothetical protein TNCV_2158381 [Trichonephila clavipes]
MEKQVGRAGGSEMYVCNANKVDITLKEMSPVKALIFDAWNNYPSCYSEMKKLAFGVLTFFGSTYSCKQASSCVNIRYQLANEVN